MNIYDAIAEIDLPLHLDVTIMSGKTITYIAVISCYNSDIKSYIKVCGINYKFSNIHKMKASEIFSKLEDQLLENLKNLLANGLYKDGLLVDAIRNNTFYGWN